VTSVLNAPLLASDTCERASERSGTKSDQVTPVVGDRDRAAPT